MADTDQGEDSKLTKYAAPKDKNCPFCGQAFTSSSLGRHLDLYIKEKNPKPADGVHDVDSIRKMRGGITRRQPRGSLPGRRDMSTPASTPKGSARKGSVSVDKDGYGSPAIPKDGQYAVDSTMGKFPFTRWDASDVISELGDNVPNTAKRPGLSRTVSRQMAQKAQFDVKQKLTDAVDTARAAELALRELLSSWRAARQQFEAKSSPFDFDPLSLDFPALTLHCLRPPPTLFSSTQHPTSTSWSVQSPGQREFQALRSYFQEKFRDWKASCPTASGDMGEELTYPSANGRSRDKRWQAKRPEKKPDGSADSLEKQVNEHLQSAYAVWDSLSAERQNEVWVLELARSVGRKHKDAETMKEEQHKLQQENENLRQQIDQLNKLQQPKEFQLSPPKTFPLDKDYIAWAFEHGPRFGASSGVLGLDDQNLDLGALVAKSIERWKSVVTSSRTTSGMESQKSLDPHAESNNVNGSSNSVPRSQSQTPQQQQSQPPEPPKRQSTASTNGAMSEHTATSTNTTAPPSVEEMSDQDADAEMDDDDSFAIMNASPAKPVPPMQQQQTLEVPRTRPMQRTQPDPRFLMQNGANNAVGRAAMNMTRSMPNMNMTLQGNTMHGGDIGLAMQGMRGDPMFLE